MDDEDSLATRAFRSGSAALAGAAPTGDLAATALAVGIAAGSEVLIEIGDRLHRSSPTQRLLETERVVRGDRARELEAYAPEIGKRLEKLAEMNGPKPGFVSNVATRFSTFREARDRCDNPRKARILMGALVGSFDPEAYHDSMTLSLFAILRDLDYVDIYALSLLDRNPSHVLDGNLQGDSGRVRPTSEMHWTLKRLCDRGLVHGSMDRDAFTRDIKATDVGRKLITLIGSDAFHEAEKI